jgi:hypothetical protein
LTFDILQRVLILYKHKGSSGYSETKAISEGGVNYQHCEVFKITSVALRTKLVTIEKWNNIGGNIESEQYNWETF